MRNKNLSQKIKIIFFDIDGTLIGINQQPTADNLPEKITAMKKQGFHFGLNSNRAKEDVKDIIETFSLDDPFILENGAYFIDTDETEHVLQNKAEENISDVVKDALIKYFASRANVSKTDTTKLYTEDFEGSGSHIFVNNNRKYTASIHHRIEGVSTMMFANEIADHLNTVFSEQSLLYEALSHEHGHSVTIEMVGVSKATGLQEYTKNHLNTWTCAIGDGSNDMVLVDEVDYFCAVSNAVPDLKNRADYVSPYPVTEGVIDILDHILHTQT